MLSETIKARLTERFAAPLKEFYQRHIIFWRDEEGEFAGGIDGLKLDGVKVVRLDGRNNFTVKKMLTVDDPIGHYLIYDPLSYRDNYKDDWLLDIRLYSEEFRADLISLLMEELYVRPSPIMRKTVKLYARFFENKERKARLKRMGRVYETPLQLHIDIIAVLCNLSAGSMQDIIMALLADSWEKENNTCLTNIEKFGDTAAFWQLIQRYTAYTGAGGGPLSDLAAHVLLTALSQTLPEYHLKGLERFISDSGKAYCYQLVHEWQRGTGREDLVEICRHLEHELRLFDRFNNIDIAVLLRSDVFPVINDSILHRYYAEINERVIKVEDIFEAVENRRTSAWYYLVADYFESLYYIAKMQEFYLDHIEGFNLAEPKEIWEFYIAEAYKMDSYYRHFHYHFGNTLISPHPLVGDALKQCVDVVEGLYREWFLKGITANWTDTIAADLDSLGYVSQINKQRDFYNKYVLPSVRKGQRVFVIISDALRFEVAAELATTLGHATRGQANVEAIQAVFPSVTKYGMAALLPGAELTTNENLEVLIDGNPTKGTAQRGAVLSKSDAKSLATTFNDLLAMKQAERRALIQGQEVVYIYHNTIDTIGEDQATEKKIFEACNEAIAELNTLVRIIVNDLSGANILITSDHGFLYTYKPLEETEKISSQTFAGMIYELKHRYTLVEPTAKADYLIPVKIDSILGDAPMKGYAPKDIVRFKVQGGSGNFVHGGISLQEMAVPVIVYQGMRAGHKRYVEVQNPGLALISESRKISNLMFSLDFLQKEPLDDKVQAATYKVYLVDASGVPVSDMQIINANRTSDNASDRVFRVRFTLKQMKFDRLKAYRLVIATDVDMPEEVDFQIDIAFADDFGFEL